MTIINALKKENIRIDYGNKWLYWENTLECWEVRIQEYRKHNSKILISTKNEELAVEILLK